MKGRRLAALAASALVAAGAAAGVTYAFWGDDASMAMPVIRSGNLALQPVGTPQWQETSPGVTHTFGMQSDQFTANHLATPGDSFTLRQQFRVVLEGDNMAARVTVRWTAPPALQAGGGVTATYVIRMPDGTTSAPTPIGRSVTVPGGADNLTPAEVAAWGSNAWTAVVTFTFTGTSSVVVAPTAVPTPPVASIGAVVIEVAQVRQGDGFQ